MDAKELRIGNYFTGYDGLRQVDLELFCLLDNDVELDEIIREFIPLTEDWLFKFGFKKDSINFQFSGIAIWFSSYSKCYQLRYCLIGSDIERKINIEHVHQLQNLFFALTGEELEIKI